MKCQWAFYWVPHLLIFFCSHEINWISQCLGSFRPLVYKRYSRPQEFVPIRLEINIYIKWGSFQIQPITVQLSPAQCFYCLFIQKRAFMKWFPFYINIYFQSNRNEFLWTTVHLYNLQRRLKEERVVIHTTVFRGKKSNVQI